jgi:hypothetical protein
LTKSESKTGVVAEGSSGHHFWNELESESQNGNPG